MTSLIKYPKTMDAGSSLIIEPVGLGIVAQVRDIQIRKSFPRSISTAEPKRPLSDWVVTDGGHIAREDGDSNTDIGQAVRHYLPRTYTINEVDLQFSHDEDGFKLRYPKSSLIGRGLTLVEAERNLRKNAIDFARVLRRVSISSLSIEEYEFREFVLSLI